MSDSTLFEPIAKSDDTLFEATPMPKTEPQDESYLQSLGTRYLKPFTKPANTPSPKSVGDIAYDTLVKPTMDVGSLIATGITTIPAFLSAGPAGLVDLAIRRDPAKATRTIETVMSAPSQAFMGAKPIEGQEVPIYDFTQGANMENADKVLNLATSPFSELHRANEAISGANEEGMPSAWRYAAGALPESIAYTGAVGIGGRAIKRGVDVASIKNRAALRESQVATSPPTPELVLDPTTGTLTPINKTVTGTGTPIQPVSTVPKIPVTIPNPTKLDDKLQKTAAERRRIKTQQALEVAKQTQENEVIHTKPVEETSMIDNLDWHSKQIINKRITELGSVEKVAEIFNTESPSDIWAREQAVERFKPKDMSGLADLNILGDNEVAKPEVKLSSGAITPDEFKILYDKKIITSGDNMEVALKAKEDAIKAGKNGDTAFEEAYVNETKDIQALSPEEQRRYYNRNMGIEQELPPQNPEAVKLAEAAAQRVDEIVRQQSQKGEPTKYKYPKTKDEVAKLSDAEDGLKVFMDKIGDKPIEEWTPEEFAEHLALMDKVAGIGIEDLTLAAETPEIVKTGRMSYEDYTNLVQNNRANIKAKVEAAKASGKFKAEPAEKKVAKEPVKLTKAQERRRMKLEKELSEPIPGEGLYEAVGGEQVSRAKEIELLRQEQQADDAGSIYEDGDMTRELDGNLEFNKKAPSFTLFADKNTELLKASEDAKLVLSNIIPNIINRRMTIKNDENAKRIVLNANKHMPLDYASAKEWFAKVNEVEKIIESKIGHQKVAYTKKAISKAKADGVISPEQAEFMKVAYSTLKKQPTSSLVITKNLPKDVSGLYDLINDFVMIKDPKVVAHEVGGHWAYYNILTAKDRAAWRQYCLDTLYPDKGKIDFQKMRRATTDPYNAVANPSEFFASKISDYMMDKVIKPEERVLFTKVYDWFKQLKDVIFKRTTMDFTGVEDIFKKVLDSEKRTEWSGVEDLPPELRRPGSEAEYSKKDTTLFSDPFGIQAVYNKVKLLKDISFGASKPQKGQAILARVKQADWGNAEAFADKVIFDTDNAGYWERFKRSAYRPYFQSPSEVRGTILERHTFNAQMAREYISYKYGIHETTINSILSDLVHDKNFLEKSVKTLYESTGIKETQNNVRKVIEGKIEGTPAERQAAADVREWLEIMRNSHKQHLLYDFQKHLNKTEYNALLDIIGGSPVENVQAKYPRLSVKVIEDIAKEFKDIDTWGIDNYIPNMMRGRFKIIANGTRVDGSTYDHVVSIGFSKSDAVRKAVDYLSDPTHGETSLKIDTDFREFDDTKVAVGSKQYYAMKGKLTNEIMKNVEDINKEVARQMAGSTMRGKFSVKPTNAYSPYLESRHDILPGEENIFPVLKSYAHSMEKKWALDRVIDAIRQDLPKMSSKEQKFIMDYMEDVKGKYGMGDKIVDDILGTSRAYSRTLAKARNVESNLKFAYRPVAGVVNLMSGQSHILAKRSLGMYKEGYQFLGTEEGKALIKDVEPFLGISVMDIGDNVKIKEGFWHPFEETDIPLLNKLPIPKPMTMFQAPEAFNRKMSIACAFKQAMKDYQERRDFLTSKVDKTPEEIKELATLKPENDYASAREFAIRANWAEQFTYDISNLPKFMRGDTARTIFQFKPYLIKEMEFMSNLTGKEWTKYSALQIAMAGPRGAIMIAKTIPILMLFPAGQQLLDEAEDWMSKNYPALSTGIGGIPALFKKEYAVDILAPTTIAFPSKEADIAGVLLGDIFRASGNILGPLLAGADINYTDYADTSNIVPILKYYRRAWDMVVDKDFRVYDNNNMYKYTVQDYWPELMRNVMGVGGIEERRVQTALSNDANKGRRGEFIKRKLKEEARICIMKGIPYPKELTDKFNKYQIDADSIVRYNEAAEQDPIARRLFRIDAKRREELIRNAPAGDADYIQESPYTYGQQQPAGN